MHKDGATGDGDAAAETEAGGLLEADRETETAGNGELATTASLGGIKGSERSDPETIDCCGKNELVDGFGGFESGEADSKMER